MTDSYEELDILIDKLANAVMKHADNLTKYIREYHDEHCDNMSSPCFEDFRLQLMPLIAERMRQKKHLNERLN